MATLDLLIEALGAMRGRVAEHDHESLLEVLGRAADARRVAVFVTEHGTNALAGIRRERDTWLGRAMETVLDEEERRLLLAAGALMERLAEAAPPPPPPSAATEDTP